MIRHRLLTRCAFAGILALVPGLLTAGVMTMHDDNACGESGSVTLRLRSRTIVDRGLLEAVGGAAPIMPKNELWQHGHSGPQLLRVISPCFGCKLFGSGKLTRKETGNTMLCLTDTIKIEVVAAPEPATNCQPEKGNCYAANALDGGDKVADLVITRKQIPGAGVFTNGHMFGDLHGKAFQCVADALAARGKSPAQVTPEMFPTSMRIWRWEDAGSRPSRSGRGRPRPNCRVVPAIRATAS